MARFLGRRPANTIVMIALTVGLVGFLTVSAVAISAAPGVSGPGPGFPAAETLDSRDSRNGPLIGPLDACAAAEKTGHGNGCYAEQPFCLVLPGELWSCVMTW